MFVKKKRNIGFVYPVLLYLLQIVANLSAFVFSCVFVNTAIAKAESI